MTLGRAPTHEDMYRSTRELCESRLPERSIFRLLAAKAHELFPDDAFADLFTATGRAPRAPAWAHSHIRRVVVFVEAKRDLGVDEERYAL